MHRLKRQFVALLPQLRPQLLDIRPQLLAIRPQLLAIGPQLLAIAQEQLRLPLRSERIHVCSHDYFLNHFQLRFASYFS